MTLPVWQGLAAQESSGDIVVLASPSVTVTDRTTGAQPNLFSDRDGNTALGNPFTANADGSIEFYVAPGRYKVVATKGGETVTWDNQLIGTVHGAEHLWKLATVEIITVAGNASSPIDDAYSADLGGNLSDGDTFRARIANANETTTPTFENTGGTPGALTITTRDGSVLWPGALEGDHWLRYEGGSSPDTYLVLDPIPDIPVSTDLLDEDDMASDSAAAVPTQQSVKAFVGAQKISSGTLSGASVDISLPSGYSAHILVIDDLQPATDAADLFARVSNDGGSNFDSGASDYQYQTTFYDASSVATGVATGSEIKLSEDLSSAALEVAALTVWIYSADDSSVRTFFQSQCAFVASDGNMTQRQVAAQRISAQADNAIRLLFSSGNISQGNYTLYGMR